MSLISDFKESDGIENINVNNGFEDIFVDFENRRNPEYESFTVEKKGGKLSFVNNGGFQSRNSSTVWCIKEADKIYKWADFRKIKIVTNDGYCKEGEFAYSSGLPNLNHVIPDFNFRHWMEVGIKDYDETTQLITEAGKEPFKIDKVGWIGNLETNKNRIKLFEMGKRFSEDLHILESNWRGQGIFISLPDLVRTYSMLIDIEGWGYSGRLKYLMFSRRPILLVDRPHKEWFFEYLKPWTHYIPVKNDLSDLIDMVSWIKKNYKDALQIGENAFAFAKEHCVREAAFKRWDKIITSL